MSSKNHYILYFTPFREYLPWKCPLSAVENFLPRAIAGCSEFPTTAIARSNASKPRLRFEVLLHKAQKQCKSCDLVCKSRKTRAVSAGAFRHGGEQVENKGPAAASPTCYLGWEVSPVTRNTGFSFSEGSIWKVSEVRSGS